MASEEDIFDIDVYGDTEDKADAPGEASVAGHLELDTAGHGNDGSRVESSRAPHTEPAKEMVASRVRRESKADTEPAKETVASGVRRESKADTEPAKETVASGVRRESKADIDAGATNNLSASGANMSAQAPVENPKPLPRKQGTKRKEAPDYRPVDNGATSAVCISDMDWWQTAEEIRGWAIDFRCEKELKDVTFNEHKVNGKSKG
jgi:hypothetical protein